MILGVYSSHKAWYGRTHHDPKLVAKHASSTRTYLMSIQHCLNSSWTVVKAESLPLNNSCLHVPRSPLRMACLPLAMKMPPARKMEISVAIAAKSSKVSSYPKPSHLLTTPGNPGSGRHCVLKPDAAARRRHFVNKLYVPRCLYLVQA